MNWFLARLTEASSWRGIILLLTVCGMRLEPDQQEAIIAAGLAIVGLLGVFTKDKAHAPDSNPLPPIELQGRSELPVHSEVDDLDTGDDSLDNRRHRPTRPRRPDHRLSVQSKSVSGQESGWNG